MSRIVLEVTDEQKRDFVLELLSALAFVDLVDVEGISDTNGGNDTYTVARHPRLHVNPNRPTMLREQAAFEKMKDALVKEYLGRYVAMFQGTVIDHDEDEIALIRRVKQSHPHETVLIKQVSREPDRILHFRSPRFVREG